MQTTFSSWASSDICFPHRMSFPPWSPCFPCTYFIVFPSRTGPGCVLRSQNITFCSFDFLISSYTLHNILRWDNLNILNVSFRDTDTKLSQFHRTEGVWVHLTEWCHQQNTKPVCCDVILGHLNHANEVKHQRMFLFQSDNDFLELLNGFCMILWKAAKHIALNMEFVTQK